MSLTAWEIPSWDITLNYKKNNLLWMRAIRTAEYLLDAFLNNAKLSNNAGETLIYLSITRGPLFLLYVWYTDHLAVRLWTFAVRSETESTLVYMARCHLLHRIILFWHNTCKRIIRKWKHEDWCMRSCSNCSNLFAGHIYCHVWVPCICLRQWLYIQANIYACGFLNMTKLSRFAMSLHQILHSRVVKLMQ